MTKPKLSAFAQAARLSAIRSRNGTQVAQRLNINQSPRRLSRSRSKSAPASRSRGRSGAHDLLQ